MTEGESALDVVGIVIVIWRMNRVLGAGPVEETSGWKWNGLVFC